MLDVSMCFLILSSRLQEFLQILDILDSNVIVTSNKYQKDLEKLEFKGTILLTEELEKTPEDSFVLKSIRDQALDTDPLYGIFTSIHRSSKGCCCGASFCN